jgi:hypothetical protein
VSKMCTEVPFQIVTWASIVQFCGMLLHQGVDSAVLGHTSPHGVVDGAVSVRFLLHMDVDSTVLMHISPLVVVDKAVLVVGYLVLASMVSRLVACLTFHSVWILVTHFRLALHSGWVQMTLSRFAFHSVWIFLGTGDALSVHTPLRVDIFGALSTP